jgi:hypothetical protein
MDKRWEEKPHHYGLNYAPMRAGKKVKPHVDKVPGLSGHFVQFSDVWWEFILSSPSLIDVKIAGELMDLHFKNFRKLGKDIDPTKSEWIAKYLSKPGNRKGLWRALQALERKGLISLERGPIVRMLIP